MADSPYTYKSFTVIPPNNEYEAPRSYFEGAIFETIRRLSTYQRIWPEAHVQLYEALNAVRDVLRLLHEDTPAIREAKKEVLEVGDNYLRRWHENSQLKEQLRDIQSPDVRMYYVVRVACLVLDSPKFEYCENEETKIVLREKDSKREHFLTYFQLRSWLPEEDSRWQL